MMRPWKREETMLRTICKYELAVIGGQNVFTPEAAS
jgi:hypothetical protein